ncbi:hypothetical protein JHK85_000995 [Glycine max]|nr:hypothetical protein JHK85_000995 [Glycine max]KAG5088350.1 hypothetical protein JHK86_000962 [Glycine max]
MMEKDDSKVDNWTVLRQKMSGCWEKMREREEREESEEGDNGWVRVTSRGKRDVRNSVSLRKKPHWGYAETRGRVQQKAVVVNWRDHKDISSFYFTRFADDTTEKELWQQFKRWGDVREIFIPNRRNYNGRRYGFVRFKGVQDIQQLTRQLDSIVIGGMKLFVNIPKYDRERRTQEDMGRQPQNKGGDMHTRFQRTTQQRQRKPLSYADVVRKKNITQQRRKDQKQHFQGDESYTSLVYLHVNTKETKWLEDAWVGRLNNPAMFERNRIRKIVGTMGDIVDVDDDVETKWRMDRARVLIRTPWTPAIKNVIEVHISGETFKVHVVEECGSMTCENHIKGSSYSDSSEEIESSDSLAGDELLRATRFAGANQELPRATAPNQRPNSPHNITVPNAGVGERILTGMTIGWKDDGYLMDNVEVPRLMTGRNGKATVNSNIEAYAAKIPPLESYLNSHESQAGKQVSVADVAHEIGDCLGQKNMALQYGPNLGQPSVILNEPTIKLGRTPPKNNNEVSCNWQVYSSGSWSHRRYQRLAGQVNANQEQPNNTQADSRSNDPNSETRDINKDFEEEANTETAQAQEAINMWEMIQQLGVTLGSREEDQQSRILEESETGKRNNRAADSPLEAKTPHFLILISEGFREAWGALSRSGITSLPSNQSPVKVDAVSVTPVTEAPPTSMPGHQHSYQRANWREHKDVISFYFTRFREDTTEKDLWYHFKQAGDVREIFISPKRNRNGRRYGFVRFKGVEDVHQMEKKLDSMVFGGLKMYVNTPKFGRTHRVNSQPVVRGRMEGQHHTEGVRDVYLGMKQVANMKLSQGSYAEANVMEEEDAAWSELFYSVEKWTPQLRPGYRLTWVQCWGIPLIAWDMQHIKQIVSSIGDMVDADDDVEELRRLDRARILIKTPWKPFIQHTVNVQIRGELHVVHIVEENGKSCANCQHRRSNGQSSSEEIQSEESDVGMLLGDVPPSWWNELRLKDRMGVCSEPSRDAPRSVEGKEEESSPETNGPCRSAGTSPPTLVDVQGSDAGNQLAESPTRQDDTMQEPLDYQTGNDDEEQLPTGHGTAENQADGDGPTSDGMVVAQGPDGLSLGPDPAGKAIDRWILCLADTVQPYVAGVQSQS